MPQALIANLAVVALFIVAWGYLHAKVDRLPRQARNCLFGLLMGAGAVASMLLSTPVEGGFLFDMRGALLVISGFFGGPLAAIITVALAAAARFALGGPGFSAGLAGILIAAAVGVAGYAILGRRRPTYLALVVLAITSALTMLLGFLALPSTQLLHTLLTLGPITTSLHFISTLVCGVVLLLERRRAEERDLLRAAMAQAPDFLYVKDLQSRFVMVNQGVAAHHGFATPRELRGKTDLDLETGLRAAALISNDQHILSSGEPMIGIEEQLPGPNGDERWYETSKTALRNPDGEIIGLAGVTRDVTDSWKLRQELLASRNLLAHAMAEMTDGLALFSADGTLMFCNEQYRSAFPLTAELRRPGTHIRDILAASAAAGEQRDIHPDHMPEWIDEVTASLAKGSVQQVEMFDGRWLHISTTPAVDGSAMVMTYDITAAHQSRLALLSLNDQLKTLATEDGLTGLLNRRTFDQMLDDELERTTRERLPLSLLMVDVDRFKAYNDAYGHPAGDKCLAAVAQCFKTVAHRPGQTVARYGGEEFVAILAGADEDGAYRVAEGLRKALRDLQLPHQGSDAGIVTVSIGIACYPADQGHRYAPDLIGRADEALYDAKAAGRDRINGWRKRHAVRLV